MLRLLRISQLAVIDSVEVEFGAGFNVLTGEAGAGKSMLVGAVGLLLGDRASGDLVRTGQRSAMIEAIFESRGAEILVRREITSEGRSRAYIDGSLATAAALRELSSRLIELHGQHEHQTLLDPSTHLGVLDAFGGLASLVEATSAAHQALRNVYDELRRVREAAADRQNRLELITFQLNELERARLQPPEPGTPEEDAELAALRQVLSSAERVARLCSESYSLLYESDGAILAGLGNVWRRVAELAALDPRFQPYAAAREGIKAQLEDLAFFLRGYADAIDASPARLQEVEERLALLERLKRKYGPTLTEVLARREALRREIDDLGRHDQRVEALEREHRAASAAYLAAAGCLSVERKRVAVEFGGALTSLLSDLGLDRTRFEVRFGDPLPSDSWSAAGTDTAEFFLSPNPGEDLRPLARVASGGELSRIMLVIKTLTATSRYGFTNADDRAPSRSAPGLIFDEVDAGIGGRVADLVGRKLRALGSAFQVLCITHLPQIAAYADTHFRIEKRVDEGRTHTRVWSLDDAGRIDELSRMLGGAAITDSLRRSAREMLEERAGRARDERSGGERAKGERAKAKGRRGS